MTGIYSHSVKKRSRLKLNVKFAKRLMKIQSCETGENVVRAICAEENQRTYHGMSKFGQQLGH